MNILLSAFKLNQKELSPETPPRPRAHKNEGGIIIKNESVINPYRPLLRGKAGAIDAYVGYCYPLDHLLSQTMLSP